MDVVLRLVQLGGDWAGPQPARVPPRCTKCNSPPNSTASVPITVLLHCGPLLCGFNVPPVKGLMERQTDELRGSASAGHTGRSDDGYR